MKVPGPVADELATRVLGRCADAGLIPSVRRIDWRAYHAQRDLVRAAFRVPETTITPLMARVLYGIAAAARPRRILGLGTYAGNALVWLTLPGFGPAASYEGYCAVGVDLDAGATTLASENFARLGGRRVDCVAADARDSAALGDGWDLLLLDVDDPLSRKEPYAMLLDLLYESLAPHALVLAHDAALPLFAEQLKPYLARVHEGGRFAGTLTLAIDECGLEVSRKAVPMPAAAR